MSLDIPEKVIAAIVRPARYGATTGRADTPMERDYIQRCSHFHWHSGTQILFTHDTGHHTGGWFKNPDFERCRHLSLSFRVPWPGRDPEELGSIHRIGLLARQFGVDFAPRPYDPAQAEAWVKAILGESRKYAWMEGPFTPLGKELGVRHFRMFCTRAWEPILPRGEVYSREFTEKGWQSYSDLGAPQPSHVNAD